jgi:excinuclease ABC subunit B
VQFELVAPFQTSPGQQAAVEQLVKNFSTKPKQTLLGITGSGKTFVMANVINKLQKPALIIAHNKTLAAQLYAELKELFPHNRVEYFISFYDFYQPESYLPAQDMYIEKDSTVNEQIEKMRMHAVSSIVSRNDTIIVASISCIYSLGNPDDFRTMAMPNLKLGNKFRGNSSSMNSWTCSMNATTWCWNPDASVCEAIPWMLCRLTKTKFCVLNSKATQSKKLKKLTC